MPWQQSDAMKERAKFVLEWEARWKANEGRVNVAELCRKYAISRETGYVWLRRFQESGHKLDAIAERSRAPLTTPTKVSVRNDRGCTRNSARDRARRPEQRLNER